MCSTWRSVTAWVMAALLSSKLLGQFDNCHGCVSWTDVFSSPRETNTLSCSVVSECGAWVRRIHPKFPNSDLYSLDDHRQPSPNSIRSLTAGHEFRAGSEPSLMKKTKHVFVFYCWDFSLMKNDFNGVKWETQSHQWRIISVKKSISVKSSSSAVKIFFICRRYLRRILSFCSRWHIPHSVLF